MAETLDRVCELFQEIFDDDELTVTRLTTAADVEGWDSLMHVNIIVAAEHRFGVRFSSSEVAKLLNVGQLVDLIDGKSNADATSS